MAKKEKAKASSSTPNVERALRALGRVLSRPPLSLQPEKKRGLLRLVEEADLTAFAAVANDRSLAAATDLRDDEEDVRAALSTRSTPAEIMRDEEEEVLRAIMKLVRERGQRAGSVEEAYQSAFGRSFGSSLFRGSEMLVVGPVVHGSAQHAENSESDGEAEEAEHEQQEEEAAATSKSLAIAALLKTLRAQVSSAVGLRDTSSPWFAPELRARLLEAPELRVVHPALSREARRDALWLLAFRSLCRFREASALHGVGRCDSAELLALGLDAVMLAAYAQGWRRSPDAHLARGLSHYLRPSLADAVVDFSAALAIGRGGRSRWAMDGSGEAIARRLLEKARCGLPPCLGRWRLVPPTPPEGAAAVGRMRRLGAASVAVGCRLYVFGGLQPEGKASCVHSCLLLLQSLQGDRGGADCPLAELLCYDLAARTLERLQPQREASTPWPPARGCASLAHDAARGRLLLCGGSDLWMRSAGQPHADLWAFDLKSETWQPLPGSHPAVRNAVGAAVCGDSLFLLDPAAQSATMSDAEPAVLLRYSFATAKWARAPRRQGGAPAPVLASPLSCWAQDRRLCCWAPEQAAEDAQSPSSSAWTVSLAEADWGCWQQLVLVGQPPPPGHGSKLAGVMPVLLVESAACFEPASRRAYVYGAGRRI